MLGLSIHGNASLKCTRHNSSVSFDGSRAAGAESWNNQRLVHGQAPCSTGLPAYRGPRAATTVIRQRISDNAKHCYDSESSEDRRSLLRDVVELYKRGEEHTSRSGSLNELYAHCPAVIGLRKEFLYSLSNSIALYVWVLLLLRGGTGVAWCNTTEHMVPWGPARHGASRPASALLGRGAGRGLPVTCKSSQVRGVAGGHAGVWRRTASLVALWSARCATRRRRLTPRSVLAYAFWDSWFQGSKIDQVLVAVQVLQENQTAMQKQMQENQKQMQENQKQMQENQKQMQENQKQMQESLKEMREGFQRLEPLVEDDVRQLAASHFSDHFLPPEDFRTLSQLVTPFIGVYPLKRGGSQLVDTDAASTIAQDTVVKLVMENDSMPGYGTGAYAPRFLASDYSNPWESSKSALAMPSPLHEMAVYLQHALREIFCVSSDSVPLGTYVGRVNELITDQVEFGEKFVPEARRLLVKLIAIKDTTLQVAVPGCSAKELLNSKLFSLGTLVYESNPELYQREMLRIAIKARELSEDRKDSLNRLQQLELIAELADAIPPGSLECDCRGDAVIIGNEMIVSMGEIKRSANPNVWKKAAKQLHVRLRAVTKCFELCSHAALPESVKQVSVFKRVGYIIVDPMGKEKESVQDSVLAMEKSEIGGTQFLEDVPVALNVVTVGK